MFIERISYMIRPAPEEMLWIQSVTAGKHFVPLEL
jgi:hypothetical protein